MAVIPASSCPHIMEERAVVIESAICAECGATGPIRVCLTCGHIGCCDSTHGHATAHARESGHPLIRELPISERSFTWCYECGAYLK